jgi:hypothetical protein
LAITGRILSRASAHTCAVTCPSCQSATGRIISNVVFLAGRDRLAISGRSVGITRRRSWRPPLHSAVSENECLHESRGEYTEHAG